MALGAAAMLLALSAIGASWRWLRPTPNRASAVRFVLGLPTDQSIRDANGTTVALSPDGSRLVYVGRAGAGRQLYTRRLDQLEVKALPGTEEAASPFFSPDGEWVAFFTEGSKLKKVALAGGAPIVLADAPAIRGGTWGDDDAIIFSAGNGLLRVSALGGRVDTLTQPDTIRGEAAVHSWPHIVPGGDAVVFMAASQLLRTARTGVLSLRGAQRVPKYFDYPCLSPRVVQPDRLLCPVADGSVLAIPFDFRKLEITGRPETVLHDATVKGGGAAVLAVANNGTIAYLQRLPMRALMMLDEMGVEQSFLESPQPIDYPRFSPDGQRMAVQIGLPGSPDIWIYQLPRGPLSRLTTGGGNLYPEWSSDGTRVIFSSMHGSGFDLYWQRADGSAPAEPLLVAPGEQSEAVMAPNGSDVVTRTGSGNARDIVTFRVGDSQVRPLAAAPGVPENSPRLSPDGKWLAYYANETGRFEVYVQPFPEPGGRWTVSTDGGNFPLWSRDGHILYYWRGTQFIAARVATSPTFRVIDRRVLFERNPVQGGHTPYEIAPDGKHFVITKPVSADANLIVVLNWVDEWRRGGPHRRPPP
jgi:serine/threonine-protein kinase